MNTSLLQIERRFAVPAERVWQLWTTPAGIEAWWSPDGFRTEVSELDLREGGALVYAMTAVDPAQVAFMEQHGMPLTTVSRKTFTELAAPTRVAYTSLIDFVPDHEPYEHLTTVDITPDGDGCRVVMQLEPLHDEVWTERIVAGRTNELDNLARVVGAGS